MLNAVPTQAVTPEQDKRFDSILKLSRNMLEDAGEGKWEHILQMQVERQQMLESYFAEPVPATAAEMVATGIREMLSIDRILMDRGKQHMGELSTDLRNISQGTKAKQAYVENM